MILNFSIQSFGPIKEKQTLSFEADKSTHLEDAYVITIKGQRILKIALIYGANASGKTTVLKALNFLRDLVLKPKSKKTEELDFKPFLFDANTPRKNSFFSLEFYQNEIKYLYEVEYYSKAIVSEELYFYSPNKANIFKRKTNLERQFTEISFGSKIKKDKTFEKTLASNTLWNNTVLGGYLKTNIEFNELQEVVDWFENYLKPIVLAQTDLENFVTQKIHFKEISDLDVVSILKKADLNISNILIEEKIEILPDGMIDFLKKTQAAPNDEIKKIEEQGIMRRIIHALAHEVNNVTYPLPWEEESQGTRRYYGLAGLLVFLLSTPKIVPIDELESSLHPDLFQHFLLSFLLNSHNSQLIATTHNREIFDNKDIFRNDAIWFTDKSGSSATELYSLADFGSTVVRDTTNILNAYKSGKLSGIPNLRDPYIDIES